MPTVDLARFSNPEFDRGASRFKEILWLTVSCFFFATALPWPSAVRVFWLRLFGAKIGQGVVIKPQVKITFPWKLTVGNHVWLGEDCWLLNLDRISIGDNVCISQRAFLCTGNHNYKSPTFDLIVKPIKVEAGAWIGASSWIGPGVTLGTHAVLTAGAIATTDLKPHGIYRGNPAVIIKQRVISSTAC